MEPAHEKIVWQCPSNIAIVKYWGKRGNQIPCNPSVSMTLSEAYTCAELDITDKVKDVDIELSFLFDGLEHQVFGGRVEEYIRKNAKYCPLFKEYAVRINSYNSFPHSTGIASSASAFGAIALALLDAQVGYGLIDNKEFFSRASELARLGSGSACRSIYGGYTVWGYHPEIKGSSDRYAIKVNEVHGNFKNMRDAILLVDSTPKKVGSSAGHAMMKDHPYAESRFRQANEHAERMMKILSDGDFEEFINIAESEALTLHAMMMTSDNYYLLMKPGTIWAIEQIIGFREETKIPVCFTLDAGPNVHLLYPQRFEEKVEVFINKELKKSLKGVIFDKIGEGPEKLNCKK